MSTPSRSPKKSGRKIRIERPISQNGHDEELLREVKKYQLLIPSQPEPNLGRVREIKEQIRRGTYVTPQVIEETAARLTFQFVRKNGN
ncbi:MAG: flagellar biosynthesis anti-sigma factor FlgM [Candidatus Omnitrophota bacterium]|nr:flagellar biosynthesis anti-sigma factor FlgM [Candidatus Omnitrophota bacterium]